MINWPYNRLGKRNAFVTLSTDFGSMIVNRFDQNQTSTGVYYGVGYNLFETSSFDPQEINLIMLLLVNLKNTRNKEIVMVDAGANVGVHALSCGRLMQGWGKVISFEAQERVFYALAGNIAMNNLFNVTAKWNALGSECGVINIPVVDYLKESSFGSLEMKQTATSENIGQQLTGETQSVRMVSIDTLNLPGLDLFKIDVERMEEDVLAGAKQTINKYRPVMHIEQLKSDKASLYNTVESFGYTIIDNGNDLIAFHKDDPIKQLFIK